MSTHAFRPLSVLVLALGSMAALAGESADAEVATGDTIEEVVVTGIRGKPRAVTDSAVPIDVFNCDAIQRVSHSDTQDVPADTGAVLQCHAAGRSATARPSSGRPLSEACPQTRPWCW